MSYEAYQPPYQAPYYPPQPVGPPPPAPIDPFRAYYGDRLRELTFNSRPIIQELSVMALQQRDQGNWGGMRVVVEEIENAVLRATPPTKLPLLYLIDSISKNIGAPYTTQLLPPIIPRLYLRTYREVDGVTKAKMEEMVALWRTSGPHGGDLYGPGVREAIERDIFGSVGVTEYQRAGFPTRERVLATLHATLEGKHRDSAMRPWDPSPTHQITVLQQIGELLNTTQVSPPELQNIMDQLKSMALVPPPSAPPPLAHPLAAPVPPHGYQTFNVAPFVGPSAPNPHPNIRPPTPNLPPFPPSLPRDTYRGPPIPQHVPTPPQHVRSPNPASSTPMPPTSVPTPTPIAAAIPMDVANILRNLNTSGLLSHPHTPEPASVNTDQKAKTGLDSYEEMILAMDVRLESIDLNRMSALPTSHLPQRCKQCGIRFPEGEATMQAHMDWHFRRNRKERETEGRGAHRRWLPRGEEWVNDFSTTSEAGLSTAPTKPTAESAKLTAEKIASLQKRWVRVPTDSTKAASPCPICKEAFKSEWSEMEEEWVWRNAVEHNGTIFHATCRMEQLAARRTNKMLNAAEGGRRSYSKSPRMTPQPDTTSVKVETVSSSVLGSAKRKAEAEEIKEEEEEEGDVKRVKMEGDGNVAEGDVTDVQVDMADVDMEGGQGQEGTNGHDGGDGGGGGDSAVGVDVVGLNAEIGLAGDEQQAEEVEQPQDIVPPPVDGVVTEQAMPSSEDESNVAEQVGPSSAINVPSITEQVEQSSLVDVPAIDRVEQSLLVENPVIKQVEQPSLIEVSVADRKEQTSAVDLPVTKGAEASEVPMTGQSSDNHPAPIIEPRLKPTDQSSSPTSTEDEAEAEV